MGGPMLVTACERLAWLLGLLRRNLAPGRVWTGR